MRIDWKNYFLNIAINISTRSTCLRRAYGAVLVKDDTIVGTGYNGSPRNSQNCCDRGTCTRDVLNISQGERYELCLSGETMIKLLDGRYRTIAELAADKKDVEVYSVDVRTGQIVPSIATNIRQTGVRNDLVRVTLDDNTSFVCTKDHKVLKRNLKYKEAGKLVVGESLMSMYYNKSQDYEHIANTNKVRKEGRWRHDWKGTTNSTSTHYLVFCYYNKDFNKEKIQGKNSKFCIHHKNKNIYDNRIQNLELMTRLDHRTLHRPKEVSEETRRKLSRSGKISQNKLLLDPSFRLKKYLIGKKNMSNNWKNPDFRDKMQAQNKEKGKLLSLRSNSDKNIIKKQAQGRILRSLSDIIFYIEKPVTCENYEKIRNFFSKEFKTFKSSTILKYFDSFTEAINLAKMYNHKVLSIEFLEEERSVYDMKVSKYHNFSISLKKGSCVFVHNCNAVHAEMNAIINSDRSKRRDSILFLAGIDKKTNEIIKNAKPCVLCEKILLNAQILKVVNFEITIPISAYVF